MGNPPRAAPTSDAPILSADGFGGPLDWLLELSRAQKIDLAKAARADLPIARVRTMVGNIALFSHGEFGLAFAARWIGLPVEAGRHLILHTASLSILTTNPAHTDVPRIALWNATPS